MIAQVVERLRQAFPHVPDDKLLALIESARGRFDGAPIRDFVPMFVERQAKGKLANVFSADPESAATLPG